MHIPLKTALSTAIAKFKMLLVLNINGVSFKKECNKYGNLVPGNDTVEMIKSALKFVKIMFPSKHFIFKDMSQLIHQFFLVQVLKISQIRNLVNQLNKKNHLREIYLFPEFFLNELVLDVLLLVIAFIRLDLPTFERPIKAI